MHKNIDYNFFNVLPVTFEMRLSYLNNTFEFFQEEGDKKDNINLIKLAETKLGRFKWKQFKIGFFIY